MNIRGISSNNNVVNLYNKNCNKATENREVQKKDIIQISTEGRTLINYGDEELNVGNEVREAKVEALRNQIQNGTYKVDATLTAKALIDTMKGRLV